MTRRMSDPAFRAEQLGELYAPHVKPVNKLVDELRVDADRWMPHLAPMHAGVLARFLVIGSDPGPNLDQGRAYEALLSVEDDNAGAARIGALLKRARIDPAEVSLWNAYPWYTAGDLGPSGVRAGLEPLRRLLELLPALEVVVLLGAAPERLWRMLTSTFADDVPYAAVLTTREADDAAFEGTNTQRHQWGEEQAETFLEAGRLLRGA